MVAPVQIENVVIVGTGLMGNGIAQVGSIGVTSLLPASGPHFSWVDLHLFMRTSLLLAVSISVLTKPPQTSFSRET